ncbi:hypothetical protein OG900_22255 [Streptomyces sp. NBC_00433]
MIAGADVDCHAAETTVDRLLEHRLLLQAAGGISADFARVQDVPHVGVLAGPSDRPWRLM